MSLSLVTAPAAYPLTLAEAKQHLVVAHGDDDALIAAYLAAATNYAEMYLCRDLVTRTWAYSMDNFPTGSTIDLPKNPVQSISSITYQDVSASPNQQTLATTVYGLDAGIAPAQAYLKYNQVWPSATTLRNSVTVTFVSGYEPLGSPQDIRGNIPEAIKSGIKLMIGDMYAHRERKLDVPVYLSDTCQMLMHPYRLYKI